MKALLLRALPREERWYLKNADTIWVMLVVLAKFTPCSQWSKAAQNRAIVSHFDQSFRKMGDTNQEKQHEKETISPT